MIKFDCEPRFMACLNMLALMTVILSVGINAKVINTGDYHAAPCHLAISTTANNDKLLLGPGSPTISWISCCNRNRNMPPSNLCMDSSRFEFEVYSITTTNVTAGKH